MTIKFCDVDGSLPGDEELAARLIVQALMQRPWPWKCPKCGQEAEPDLHAYDADARTWAATCMACHQEVTHEDKEVG